MAKATPLPNSVNFPRHHQVCDHCGKPASWHLCEAVRRERDTAAGTFRYQICIACSGKIEALDQTQRDFLYTKAIVRHAAYYSTAYGRFVAGWFGVSPVRLGRVAP